MKKLLILEKGIDKKMTGYDHVFSYVSNPADSFPEDYISRQETNAIYRDLFKSVYDYLSDLERQHKLLYRGVPLLTCFQKEPFQDLYFLALRLAIFERVLARHKPAHCEIFPKSATTFGSSLVLALKGHEPVNTRVAFLPFRERQSKRQIFSLPAFPFTFVKGNMAHVKTLVYSDYKKSIDVLNELPPRETIVFQNHSGVRTIFRAFRQGVNLYEIFHARTADAHPGLVKDISDRLAGIDHPGKMRIGPYDLKSFFAISVQKVVQERIPGLLADIDAMHDFFRRATQLKTAFLDEDITSAKKAFCYIARQYGVKTFVEMHGVLADRHGYIPLTADHIFVWGQAQKNKLMEWGVPQKRILISGCSWHERYKQTDVKDLKQRITKKLGIMPAARVVLFGFPATNGWRLYFENQRKNYIQKTMDVLLEILEQEPQPVHAIIKIRPGDTNKHYYSKAIKGRASSNRVTLLEHFDALQLMMISDFIVSFDSTFSLEGFSLGKNVLNLYEGLENLYSEYRPYNFFYNAETPEAFREELRALIRDPLKRKPGWETARRECLNEGVIAPQQIISNYLTHIENHLSSESLSEKTEPTLR